MIRKQNTLFQVVLFFIVFFSFFIKCEECVDCKSKVPQAGVIFEFINIDSITEINLLITEYKSTNQKHQKIVDSLKIRVKKYQDSILVLQKLVDAGETSYLKDIDSLNDSIAIFNTEISTLNSKIEANSNENTKLNAILSKLNNKKLLIREIKNKISNKSIFFEDSTNSYFLSLNPHDTKSIFEFDIVKQKYEVEFSHQNSQEVDISRNYKFYFSNIELVRHNFDSINITCANDTCLQNQITLTCYF